MWLRLYNVDWPESLSFLFFSVSSLWYAAADGEQAIRSESWRIYLCNSKPLSGYRVLVYVPAAVVWWRSRMSHGRVVISSAQTVLRPQCMWPFIGGFKENQHCKSVFSGTCLWQMMLLLCVNISFHSASWFRVQMLSLY